MADIVYPVKDQKTHEELRYSLRSLKNYPHDNVFLGGFAPRWVRNVTHIYRQKDGIDRYRNAFMNVRAVLNDPTLGEELIIMNDDFYIMQPIDKMPISRGRQVGFSTWKAAAERTLKIMKSLGCWSGYSYEQHLPFVCEKTKLIYIMDHIIGETQEFGKVFWRTIYGNYYRIGGEQMEDVKVRANPRFSPNQKFLSSEDTTFANNIGKHLEMVFPEKCIYEK